MRSKISLEKKSTSLFLQGKEIRRYNVLPSGKVVIVPYEIKNGKAELMPENCFKSQFPLAYSYLRKQKNYLESREKGKFKGKNWYAYGRNQNIDLMLIQKILVPDIANKASFAIDNSGDYSFTSGYGITLNSRKESYLYFLGLLNSKLSDFYLKKHSTQMRGGFYKYETRFLKSFPVKTIDFNENNDVKVHNQMVYLVERMLQLNKDLQTVKTPNSKQNIQRQIEATDKQIDKLVYELYNLTEEEIKIVEESSKN